MTEAVEANFLEYDSIFPDGCFYNANSGNNTLVERKQHCSSYKEEGFIHDIVSPDGIHFRHSNLLLNKPRKVMLCSHQPFFHLYFSVRNNNTYKKPENNKQIAAFRNYEYNVLYMPGQQAEMQWEGDNKIETFELNLSQELLEAYVPDNHPFLQELNKTKRQQAISISPANIPITPQIMSVLLDILNCPLEKSYKRLFIKAKTIELISVVFSQMVHVEENSSAKNTLKETEIKKMQQAREILHDNLQSPCSLIDLAHRVGTNENYLKKHFKQLYGNTVYGYIQELRMQQAKAQLLQNEQISFIAQSVGYKNVHHFSVAFKKYFGYSPHSISGDLISP